MSSGQLTSDFLGKVNLLFTRAFVFQTNTVLGTDVNIQLALFCVEVMLLVFSLLCFKFYYMVDFKLGCCNALRCFGVLFIYNMVYYYYYLQ